MTGFTEKELVDLMDSQNISKENQEIILPVSMLYYLGYLTIAGEELGKNLLKIPNTVMKEIYASYFMDSIGKETELRVSQEEYNKMLEEMAYRGEINKIYVEKIN